MHTSIPYSSTFRLASVVGEGDNFHVLLKIGPSAGEELQTLHEGVSRSQLRHLAPVSQIMRTTMARWACALRLILVIVSTCIHEPACVAEPSAGCSNGDEDDCTSSHHSSIAGSS